jgi:hypothetical protein
MPAEDIERDFPALVSGAYKIKSPEDFNYNCLAFALGDYRNWWEPPGNTGSYWPDGFPGDITVPTAVAIFKLHGFTVESDGTIQPATDSVAIYADGDEWTHFSKFTGGAWLSKLGEGHDIEHSSPQALEGRLYGKVVRILSRAK